MLSRILVGIYLVYLAAKTSADSISNFIILDQEGKNTCIGDLHCFFSLHNEKRFTLSFDLTLEKDIEKTLYTVVIEKASEADVMKKELLLCYDDVSKNATLTENCSGNADVPAGTYHIDATIDIPTFKDIASMIIKGPNGAEGFRGVVSTLSSQPPIQLCNPRNGAC